MGSFLSLIALLAVAEPSGQLTFLANNRLFVSRTELVCIGSSHGAGVCDSRVRLEHQAFLRAWLQPRALRRHRTSFYVHMCVCSQRYQPRRHPVISTQRESWWWGAGPGEPVSLRPGALQVLSGRGEQTPVRLRAAEPNPGASLGIIPDYASKLTNSRLFSQAYRLSWTQASRGGKV